MTSTFLSFWKIQSLLDLLPKSSFGDLMIAGGGLGRPFTSFLPSQSPAAARSLQSADRLLPQAPDSSDVCVGGGGGLGVEKGRGREGAVLDTGQKSATLRGVYDSGPPRFGALPRT